MSDKSIKYFELESNSLIDQSNTKQRGISKSA